MENTNNFGNVICDSIKDRVGVNGEAVYAREEFGALAPAEWVLHNQVLRIAEFARESVGKLRGCDLGEINPDID
jgi:hypothetical protein